MSREDSEMEDRTFSIFSTKNFSRVLDGRGGMREGEEERRSLATLNRVFCLLFELEMMSLVYCWRAIEKGKK